MDVYPIFLTDLRSRRCLVIGGDGEAERKVDGLLAARAGVTVISETLTDTLADRAGQGQFTWLARACRPGDLQGAWLAIATVRDPALAARLKDEAERYGVLLNVADDAPHSNFVHGAVVRRGPLAVAVSTSGRSPALASRIRRQLDRTFGPEYAEFLDILGELRRPLADREPDSGARLKLWQAVLDSEMLDLLRQGRREQARQLAERLLRNQSP